MPQKPIDDTGWKPMEQIRGDVGADGRVGENYVKTMVQPVTGLEQQPCFMCKSWEKNDKRLRQHIASKKNIEVLPDGTFRHIIDKDVKDRNTKTYNIRDFGFCRFTGMPTQQLASCEHWVPTKRLTDLRRKLGG